MAEFGEPWAWAVKKDGAALRLFVHERHAMHVDGCMLCGGDGSGEVVPLYPLPDALRGLDPAAVARVVEAARVIDHERDYRDRTAMHDNYTDHARSRDREAKAFIALRAALAALAPGKEETK